MLHNILQHNIPASNTTTYCGSIFVGHCTSKDLLHHFYIFKYRRGWLYTVKQSFLNQLKDELDESDQGRGIIDIGSYPLHIVSNTSILTYLKPVIDLDLFATDLNFFFKRSAARREDFMIVETITEITTHYMKKHVESRWLSIDKSLVQILEQFQNLKEYFLNHISKPKRFNSKAGLSRNDCYKIVTSILKDSKYGIYMSFVIFTAQAFNWFLDPLKKIEQKKIEIERLKKANEVEKTKELKIGRSG